MDEEMITLHNVMPVKLAIEREMEYRSKLEVLRNRRFNNLSPLLPSQVHPANPATLKRKEPSSSGTALERRSTGLICKICQITFGTILHLKQHSETIRHKGNLCNSSCSSGIVMADHLKGTKHATILQEFENAKRARAVEEAFAANRIEGSGHDV
ncbi:hypothetical protein OSB04_021694 [Centaurea solstitialis]|uniref:C2H2-type domain-containing protein n=1 Tax=Centaurea solstitialis TaxID=347529 RepID=A0AA38T825_9ASTR|nr:hypothetical protein OSB04_021694 [Centaurea solstitialis]